MTEAELITWFDRLVLGCDLVMTSHEALEWVIESESALNGVFGGEHPVRINWAEVRRRHSIPYKGTPEESAMPELAAVLRSALKQLREGRLRTLADGVRAESVSECLDIADTLLAANYAAPGMVMAGGGLEIHLHHLCRRFSLTWNGTGSIQHYNAALNQARNNGVQTITSADGQQVTSWGIQRNQAAHDPVNFNVSIPQVRLIVQGIREFVGRTQ